MPAQTVVLTDFDSGIDLPTLDWELPRDDPSAAAGFVRARVLHGGTAEGVKCVEISNGLVTLAVLPTRGMSIWKGTCGELPLEWRSPVPRPVHPAFVNLHDRNGLGWLHGFNELFVRCGLGYNGPPGVVDGTPITLHGRIANLPAHHVSVSYNSDGPGTLTLMGVVDETSMFGPGYRLTSTIVIERNQPRVRLIDTIENIGGVPAPLSLLYHINIGRPFLSPAGGNVVAFEEMAPRDARSAAGVATHDVYRAPEAGWAEEAFYYRPVADEEGWSAALLHNEAQTAGFLVRYQTATLPWFVVWKNTQSDREGYVTGLEPAVNFPNFHTFEKDQGRLPVLQPGDRYQTEMEWSWGSTIEEVRRQRDQVEQLQRRTPGRIHSLPRAGWSPSGQAPADP